MCCAQITWKRMDLNLQADSSYSWGPDTCYVLLSEVALLHRYEF